jgi:hypothetical protein
MEAVTVRNVMALEFEDVREYCFAAIHGHEDKVQLDPQLFVTRLGEYAALYQYFAELYAYLIGRVRAFTEARNVMAKLDAITKRDCLELVLKTVKLQYESLSRKVTVLQEEDQDGSR